MDKHKILYVDDEPANLLLFEVNLENKYHVLTAESGSDGLEILSGHRDVIAVISDMKMPGMDGIEFLTKLKMDFPGMKCFIFTGYGVTPEIQQALNNNLILRCLNKPMDMREIAKIVVEAIES